MTRRTVFTVAGQAVGRPRGFAARRCPRSPSPSRRSSTTPEETWEGVGALDDFTADTYAPGGDHDRRRHRRGRQDHRLRPPGQPESTSTRAPDELHRDLHPLRPPRLPGPLRPGRRQLHLPLPRRRLRLRGQGHRRPAGAPARPLPDPRRRRPASRSARATASPRDLEPVRARDPGEFTGGIWEYLYPPRPSTHRRRNDPSHAEAPAVPKRALEARKPGVEGGATAATAQRQRRRRQAAYRSARRRPPTSSAGSTSAPAPPASSPRCSSARCRRAPTGSTPWARRRCSPSSSRRSPASSWRCTTRRRRPRPTPRSPTSPTTSSWASSSAACTSGAPR